MTNDLISRSELKNHKFVGVKYKLIGGRTNGKTLENINQAYQQGWNDAIDAIIDNAPTVEKRPQDEDIFERMKLIQESVDCVRNTFNLNTESDKLVRNCMSLVQNAIDGEYHDMEEVDVSKIERPKGEWIIDGHHIRCNRCNEYICNTDREGNKIPDKFCPNCGAEMREADNEHIQ